MLLFLSLTPWWQQRNQLPGPRGWLGWAEQQAPAAVAVPEVWLPQHTACHVALLSLKQAALKLDLRSCHLSIVNRKGPA